MEIKSLQQEIIDAERLAERGRIILGLNEQLAQAQQQIKELQTELATLKKQEVKDNG